MPHRGTILVIEDDRTLGDFISDALHEEGYAVRVVPEVALARAALATHMPDLLLCDLPPLASRDLLVELRRTLPSDVPLVVVTADRQTTRQLDVLNAAFCLIKPFDLEALLACVAAHMRVPLRERSTSSW